MEVLQHRTHTAALDVLTTHKADPEAVGAQHYAVYTNSTVCANVLKVPLCSYIHCVRFPSYIQLP